MQEEQGQTPAEHSGPMQSVTEVFNGTDTSIGSSNVGETEKAGWKADSVQSVENRKLCETLDEKQQFICESFQLDASEILNADKKLKEALIKFV